jgi:hypothetical protein
MNLDSRCREHQNRREKGLFYQGKHVLRANELCLMDSAYFET